MSTLPSLEPSTPEQPENSFRTLPQFEEEYRDPDSQEAITTRLAAAVSKRKSEFSLKRSCFRLLPIVKTFRNYRVKEDLPNDMIAGVTAGVMMIPQGMAFAALSTLPPIVGLYISFFASLTYFLLGTGRQLSWGCIAILSLMMASILDKYDEKMAGGGGVAACINKTVGSLSGSVTDPTPVLYSSDNSSSAALNLSNVLSPLSTPAPVPDLDTEVMSKRLEVASAVSVVAGIILLAASRLGLSRITCLMSNSLITGFTVGISFHVVTSQVKGILGLSIPRMTGYASIIKTWILIFSKLPETNLATLVISIISMLVIYLVKRFVNEKYKEHMRVPIPIELFVVIIATLVSNFAHLHQKFDIKVVEDVPMGIPAPRFPDLSLATDYIGDGVIIIVIAYAQTLAMAKTMGLKHNYVVDSNQEMLACGIVSIVCGVFSGYISASSVSRTVVQDGAGGKTQVASLFASAMVLLVIVVVGQYFYFLPMCVLSSIIIINLRTMFLKLFVLPSEWRKSKYDCAVWLFACFSTVVLNADMGLLASILFSLLLIILRAMLTPVLEVGQIPAGHQGAQLRSVANYSAARTQDSVKIIKLKTPLYYVNADIFVNKVFSKTGIDPTRVKKKSGSSLNALPSEKETYENGVKSVEDKDSSVHVRMLNDSDKDNGATSIKGKCIRVVVLDASEVSFVDLMGIQALQFVISEFASVGVKVLISCVSEGVIPMMQSSGFWKKNGDSLFLTVESALESVTQCD